MPSYDPAKPVNITNWPRGLKVPPLRRALSGEASKTSSKPMEPISDMPTHEADERVPWWR